MYGSLSLGFLAVATVERSELGRSLVEIGVLSFEAAADFQDAADADRLSEAISRTFAATAAGSGLPERDVATINSYASDEPPTLVLRIDGSVARNATAPVRAALAAVARDAVETIAHHALDLRTCEGRGCGRMFLDRSRAKGRRWCSMRRCGNRTKVAAFRRLRSG